MGTVCPVQQRHTIKFHYNFQYRNSGLASNGDNKAYVTQVLTFGVIAPTMYGAIMPGMLAPVFVNPNTVPAYLGAISPWLMKNELNWNPQKPIDRDNRTTAST